MSERNQNLEEAITVGQTVLNFRLVEKLGAGAKSPVYKAEHTTDGQKVILRFLPLKLAANDWDRETLLAHFKSVAKLNNPTIAKIQGVEEFADRLLVIGESVDGRQLADILADPHQTLDLQNALDYTTQIAEGLETAHERGMVHGELMPTNITITPTGRVKILNLGLALSRELNLQGGHQANEAYQSPEQKAGEQIDHRSDIFALGMLLLHMLTSLLPITETENRTVSRLALTQQERLNTVFHARVLQALDRVLDRALAYDRKERYSKVGEMLADLLNVRKQLAWEPPSHSLAARTKIWKRRSLFAAVALLGLVVALWYFR